MAANPTTNNETTNLEAELAAVKEELAAIKQLLEQHHQAQ